MAFDWKRKDLRRIEEDKLFLWSEANLLINNTDIPSKRIQLVVLTVQFILCKHWQRKIHIKLTKASSNLQKITSIRPSPRLFPLILNLSSLILLIGGNWRRCFVFPFVCKISRRWNPSKTNLTRPSLSLSQREYEFIESNLSKVRRNTGNFIYYPCASYRVFLFLKIPSTRRKSIENTGTSNSIGFPLPLSLSLSSIKKTFPLWKQTRLGQNTSGNEKLAPRQSTFTHRVDDLKIRSAPVPSAAGKIPLFVRIYSLFLPSPSQCSFFSSICRAFAYSIRIYRYSRSLSRGPTLFPCARFIVDAGNWSTSVPQVQQQRRFQRDVPRRKDYWHSIREVSGKVSVHEERNLKGLLTVASSLHVGENRMEYRLSRAYFTRLRIERLEKEFFFYKFMLTIYFISCFKIYVLKIGFIDILPSFV